MERLSQQALDNLRSNLSGQLILPDDEEYENAKMPWMRIFDQKPALIVQSICAGDIVQAVLFAQKYNLSLGIQGTGHGIAKACNGGLLLNLSKMTNLVIDPTTQRARVGPGIKWSDLLAAAQSHGLVAPSGQVGNVGVFGYTLGGGIGWLVHKYGPACNYIVSAKVVLATGEVISVSEQENSDLFWALRGGGGNFGVLTELELQLVLENQVLAGSRYYSLEQVPTLLPAFIDWTKNLSENTSSVFRFVSIPDSADFPESLRNKVCCVIELCHADLATADVLLTSMSVFGKPILDQISTMHYMNLADMNPASHEASSKSYGQAAYLDDLCDTEIYEFIRVSQSAMTRLVFIELLHLGGCLKINELAGAFNATPAKFLLHTEAMIVNSSQESLARATQDVFNSLKSSLTGELNFNFMRGDQQPDIAKAFAEKDFKRLRVVKERYDPNNVFCLNLNIDATK